MFKKISLFFLFQHFLKGLSSTYHFLCGQKRCTKRKVHTMGQSVNFDIKFADCPIVIAKHYRYHGSMLTYFSRKRVKHLHFPNFVATEQETI